MDTRGHPIFKAPMNPIKIPRLKTDRRIVQQSMQELDLVDMLSWIEMALGSKGPKNGQVLNQQKCYGLESTQIREIYKKQVQKVHISQKQQGCPFLALVHEQQPYQSPNFTWFWSTLHSCQSKLQICPTEIQSRWCPGS